MRIVLIAMFLLVGCMEKTPTPKVSEPGNVTEAAAAAVDIKEEDCDDKAKQPVEIKEEGISLSGNTGCTLEE